MAQLSTLEKRLQKWALVASVLGLVLVIVGSFTVVLVAIVGMVLLLLGLLVLAAIHDVLWP